MLKIYLLVMLTALNVFVMNTAFAEAKEVRVNGVLIPQARIDLRVKTALAQGQADTPALRKTMFDELINMEVMSQEAVKQGLNKDADVSQQLEMTRQSVLAAALVQNVNKKITISDEQIKQEYERLNSTLDKKEYNVRHILLATESEAKAIIAQLGKNESFEKLSEKSKDANTAALGGSLGWVRPGVFVPALANAIVKLSKGSYSKEPVQTQLGWHVIKVDDERAITPPPLADVKSQLQQRLQQQAVQKSLADLRAKAKVE